MTLSPTYINTSPVSHCLMSHVYDTVPNLQKHITCVTLSHGPCLWHCPNLHKHITCVTLSHVPCLWHCPQPTWTHHLCHTVSCPMFMTLSPTYMNTSPVSHCLMSLFMTLFPTYINTSPVSHCLMSHVYDTVPNLHKHITCVTLSHGPCLWHCPQPT